MAGLGRDNVRQVPAGKEFSMDMDSLQEQIAEDRHAGREPFLVVANAGTTGTGTLDPLEEIGAVCRREGLWFHVDAAYGGAGIMDKDLASGLSGTAESDSLIVDLHKWFSVPMAASLFITRHPGAMGGSFSIHTEYMPGDARDMAITDPFSHSFQWSRRFIGLKIYLSLLIYGREGMGRTIRHQARMGQVLRDRLKERGWKLMNPTPLPVICFTDPDKTEDPGFARKICDYVVHSGKAWISVYKIGDTACLRACITNYKTGEEELGRLVEVLEEARVSLQK
jgi:glutamate/tyrosine decarboxylase-like PLP-dependent enzyme